ncbi:MAG: CDP-alcohol phosphatidyltransferase family protein [Desulfurellales bacterium]|nr:MAG: CDP-alcohol phosphatidyltransferase family protein [Desulfurellales bacterium]
MSAIDGWIEYQTRIAARKRMKWAYIPSAITIIGAALSLAWLLRAVPWWIGAFGLACDVLDGFIARRLQVETEFGSLLDWSVDMTLFALAITRSFSPEIAITIICGALPLQIGLRVMNVHFCGRAIAFAVLFGREAFA